MAEDKRFAESLVEESSAILTRISKALSLVAGILILIIMVATLIGVVTRYVFRDPVTWPYPVSSYLLLWVIYLATSRTFQNGEHVRIDFVLNLLPASVRTALEIVGQALTSVFLIGFFWQTFKLFWRSWLQNTHDTSTLNVPLAWVQVIMPVGLLLLFLASITQLIQQVRQREAASR